MEPNVKSQFDAAEAAYKDGNFLEAEAAYLKGKELAPRNAHILSRLGDIALLSNRPKEAIEYFNKALDNTPWYLNIWPLNVQTKSQLGMAYYRQDRFAEAGRYFLEAAGPVNIGDLKIIKALGEFSKTIINQNTYVIAGPAQTKVDFVITDPLPVIKVSVNGGEPQNFLIDTGGPDVLITKKYADQLGVKIVASFAGSYAGGQKGETGLGKIESLQLAELLVKNVPIIVVDLPEQITGYNNLDIKGVIGTRFLMHFLSTIDYANGALVLKQVTPENLKNLDEQISSGGAKVIPFWMSGLHVMLAQGTFNNQPPALFFVDTGLADGAFTSNPSILEATGIKIDWTNAQTAIGAGGAGAKSAKVTFDRLTMGTGTNEIIMNNAQGFVNEKGNVYIGDELGFHVGGLISHAFFRKYALTFDFTNMRMIVQ